MNTQLKYSLILLVLVTISTNGVELGRKSTGRQKSRGRVRKREFEKLKKDVVDLKSKWIDFQSDFLSEIIKKEIEHSKISKDLSQKLDRLKHKYVGSKRTNVPLVISRKTKDGFNKTSEYKAQ